MMRNKAFIISLFILFFPLVSKLYSNQVDTISVYSAKMQTEVKNIVILPTNYNKSDSKKYPVIYLLHGYGANYTSWLTVVKKNLPDLSTLYDCIIVCPDGKNSWYWDSPINKESQYETYIASELIKAIDTRYSTIKEKRGRAISGFSMGGHGALWLTINHPEIFGACGSMSGGVDIRPFPNNWDISKLLGKYNTNKMMWDSHTVITQIDKLKDKNISIIIDCGESDFFFDINQNLHQKMLNNSITHTYITSPGNHTPSYWRKSIDKHIQFFTDFFDKN